MREQEAMTSHDNRMMDDLRDALSGLVAARDGSLGLAPCASTGRLFGAGRGSAAPRHTIREVFEQRPSSPPLYATSCCALTTRLPLFAVSAPKGRTVKAQGAAQQALGSERRETQALKGRP